MDTLNHIPDGIFVAMIVAGVVILAAALAWGTTHYRARRKDGAEIAPGGEVGHNYAADKPRRDTPPRRHT